MDLQKIKHNCSMVLSPLMCLEEAWGALAGAAAP